MERKEVIYQVNGVAVSFWKRLAASKTFWIVAAFVLTAADRWNRGEISGSDFFQIAQIGVIGILIRTALTRAELAANAGNPTVGSVAASERKVSLPPEATAVAMGVLASGAMVTLTACCC